MTPIERLQRVVELAEKKVTPLSGLHTIRAAVRDVPSVPTFRFVFGCTEDILPALETLEKSAPAMARALLALWPALEEIKAWHDDLNLDGFTAVRRALAAFETAKKEIEALP